MSLFSRLRSVVAGDDYLDGDYDDELEYDGGEISEPSSGSSVSRSSALATTSDFSFEDPFAGTNVIGMPGLSSQTPEITLMEPRSFDEMPRATFAIDGHQERIGESIFLFAPSCVSVTTALGEETASPTVVQRDAASQPEQDAAPSPAWGRHEAAV